MSPYLRITPLLLVFPGRYSMLERRMVRTAMFLHPEIGFMLQRYRLFQLISRIIIDGFTLCRNKIGQ